MDVAASKFLLLRVPSVAVEPAVRPRRLSLPPSMTCSPIHTPQARGLSLGRLLGTEGRVVGHARLVRCTAWKRKQQAGGVISADSRGVSSDAG